LIDPRATKTAMLADLYLPSDAHGLHLLNGIARVLIEEGWGRPQLHRRAHDGFRRSQQHLARYDIAYTAKVTGLTKPCV